MTIQPLAAKGASTRPGVYKCKDCRKPFSVTVGTVMERSHIPLCKWVLASQLMASSKKGFSAHELHRVLGTNYETAWFLFHRLREAMNDPAFHIAMGDLVSNDLTEPRIFPAFQYLIVFRAQAHHAF